MRHHRSQEDEDEDERNRAFFATLNDHIKVDHTLSDEQRKFQLMGINFMRRMYEIGGMSKWVFVVITSVAAALAAVIYIGSWLKALSE